MTAERNVRLVFRKSDAKQHVGSQYFAAKLLMADIFTGEAWIAPPASQTRERFYRNDP
jgi:hypothetical protein